MWLCNVAFSNKGLKSTGSWLQPLAEALVCNDCFEISNITLGNVRDVSKQDFRDINQWIIPSRWISRRYGNKMNNAIKRIIDEYKPDLVHIWGTEGPWLSAYYSGYIKCTCLVDIQGLLFACYKRYFGQLTIGELLQTIGLREILHPKKSVFFQSHFMRIKGKKELEFLRNMDYISTQSDWVRGQLMFECPQSHFYNTRIILRNEFLDSQPWKPKQTSGSPILLTTTSGIATPYKGLHTLIKAVSRLKQTYPNVMLRIVGDNYRDYKIKPGYSLFLHRLINKLDLHQNIFFTGCLSAKEIVKEIQGCSVFVVPSYVETYCLGLAEAMAVGAPCVVSYSGALPEQAINGIEALFYMPDDECMCAYNCERLIKNIQLAESMSIAARKRKQMDNNPNEVVITQCNIYDSVLSKCI